MNEEYYKKYKKIEKNMRDALPDYLQGKNIQAFCNGIRRVSNKLDDSIDNPKIVWIYNRLLKKLNNMNIAQEKDKPLYKAIIYSNYKDAGIDEIYNKFKDIPEIQSKIKSFTGSLTKKKRNEIIQLYNEQKIQVLLITSAGAEVLDLKGTSDIIVLEPHWNIEKINQVLGRAIRYKSHELLPMQYRHVKIFKLILSKPPRLFHDWTLLPKAFREHNVSSVDELLYSISEKKEKQFETIKNYLKEQSI